MPRCDLAEVDRRWEALCLRNPAFFDGRLLHVFAVTRNGHGGATVHAAECAYRFWAVGVDRGRSPSADGGQRRSPAQADPTHAGLDTGVRPLGVKAIVACGERVLLGRRSDSVAAYPGWWEFAPGGAVVPGQEPREAIVAELGEETGVTLVAGDRVAAKAILFDDMVRTWEIVFEIRLETRDPAPLSSPTGEYSELAWVEREALVSTREGHGLALTHCAAAMAALLRPTKRSCRT